MKSIKKLKKYGTAAAASALLVGATLTGAAASSHGGSSGDGTATLGDYPHPFVDEDGTVQSSIVVGDDAKTVDVVGAVDIAGSLSQAAYTSEEVETEGSTTVNGAETDVRIRPGTDGLAGNNLVADASDFDGFLRKTVTDDDDTDHFITEKSTLNSGQVTQYRNGSEVVYGLNKDAVTYTVNFAPGFAQGETLEMLGNEYEVTDVDESADEVTLGSTVTEDQLGLDETYEHGPYTVKVEDFNENDNSVLVQVSKDGESLTMQGLKSGEHFTVDNEKLNVSADSVYFGSQGNYISLSSTYSDTTITNGESFALDEDYDVTGITYGSSGSADTGKTVQSITLGNEQTTTGSDPAETDANDVERLTPGTSFGGPADYFNVAYQGLTEESTETVTIEDGPKFSFTDVEGFDHTIDLSQSGVSIQDKFDDGTDLRGSGQEGTYYVDIKGHPVQIEVSDPDTTDDEIDLAIDYETFSWSQSDINVASGNTDSNVDSASSGYGFTVDVDTGSAAGEIDITSDGSTDNTDNEFATQLGSEWTYDGTDFHLAEGGDGDDASVTEVYTDETNDQTSVRVTFSSGVNEVFYENEDGEAYAEGDGNGLNNAINSEDKEGRTTFGSVVDVAGDKSPVTLTVPEKQLKAQVALGEVTESSGDAVMTQSPAGWPDVGHLDTDENVGQVKQNDNLILVGGPSVNDLTQELAADNQTWESSEYSEGQSILQLTEGFEGGHALVVAGHSGEDTRVAAQFLSNYESHSEALAGQEQVTISTETGNVVE